MRGEVPPPPEAYPPLLTTCSIFWHTTLHSAMQSPNLSCRDTNYTMEHKKKGGTAQQSASKCSANLQDSLVGGFNHLGKIWVNGKDFPRLVEKKNCLKPPASLKSVAGTMAIHDALRTRRTVWTNDDTKTKSCRLPTAARKSAHI